MSILRPVVVAAVVMATSGCINSTSLVKVKPDGSGTIEQTLLVNLAAAKGLMAGMGGGQVKESGVLSEAEFKRSAERMGVRPVSLTPMKDGAFEGAKAIYAFDDITKVRLDQDAQIPGSSGSSPIKFGLSRQGAMSVLTITVDEKVTASATDKVKEAPSLEAVDPAVMQMLKTMFNGFRVLVDLEVDGKIVKTNADYVNGSKVTMLELDLASVFDDQEKLKALQSKVKPGTSLSELRPLLKEFKGVKINRSSVTIEYR